LVWTIASTYKGSENPPSLHNVCEPWEEEFHATIEQRYRSADKVGVHFQKHCQGKISSQFILET